SWACGAPLPLPAFDSSVPCSSFYALNQLSSADIARMKAQACLAQDLTLSGDVTAHVDQGVNDSAYEYDQGVNGDNLCGQAFGQYGATIKFSVGDETFQLNLVAFGSPSVGPGQEPAGDQFSSHAG